MSVLKSFLRSTSGNTAIIFSLAAIPMLLAAGSAIDMLRANRAQAVLQGAADAAALAGGTSSGKKGDVKDLVKDYLEINGAQSALDYVESIDVKKNKKKGTLTVEIKGKINTSLMALAGISTMDVGAMSEVQIGNRALEISLVLDNTGSMNEQGRLTALKASAKELVTQVFENKDPDTYVKIGIVPFANYVNVGLPRRSEDWMNVPPDSTYPTEWLEYPDWKESGVCHMEPNTGFSDGVPVTGEHQVCDPIPGQSVLKKGTGTNQWNGCVGSRNNPMDTQVGSHEVPYPGIMNEYCPTPITDLTDDKSLLIGKIDAMVGYGDTYIPAGMLWGWNMLNTAEPLSSAKSKEDMAEDGGTKAIILMTDGLNSMVPVYPTHASANGPAPSSDTLLASVCGNAKADDIEVYTVAFMVDDAATLSNLAKCASDPTKVYTAANSAALSEAFKRIAETLSAVRLTK
jgi:Flp pilus assembly protein TadG